MLEWLLGQPFDVDKDIPNLSGKVILVTGGNAGLGKETALQLAKHSPKQIFLAARSETKAAAAISEIETLVPNAAIEYLPLDLTSFASIQHAAQHVNRRTSRLDILINNAGVMALPFSLTTHGYEVQFGTNHMGHALLTRLLLPLLLRTAAASPTADVRVINVSSVAHALAPRSGIIYDSTQLQRYHTLQRYGQSKLANIWHAQELQRRHPSITAVAVHPGIIITDLYGTAFEGIPFGSYLTGIFQTVATKVGMAYDVPGGVHNTLWAVVAPRDRVRSSPYWRPIGLAARVLFPSKTNAPRELWDWTEHEFEQQGY